jgi:hypothetical protein
LVILLGLCTDVFSQSVDNKYLIVTFEVTHKPSPHKGAGYYFWITPTSALKSRSFQLMPMRFSWVDKETLKRCKNGDSVNVNSFPGSSDDEFDTGYGSMVDTLQTVVKSNRLKVQTIITKGKNYWGSNYLTTVNVYLTPVIGEFCNCLNVNKNGKYVFSRRKIYLPVSFEGYYKDFWNEKISEKARLNNYSFIRYIDYLLDEPSGPSVEK